MDASFLDNYRFLARYNRWMNQSLYAACDALTEAQRKAQRGAFFESIQRSLAHLVLADKMWLVRFAQQNVSFKALPTELVVMPEGVDHLSDVYPDWAELALTRHALDVAIEQWLAEIHPEFLSSTMRYANTKGVERAHPAWQALTHFFNHQTHHRGQVTTLFSQAGVDVGVTDLIALV